MRPAAGSIEEGMGKCPSGVLHWRMPEAASCLFLYQHQIQQSRKPEGADKIETNNLTHIQCHCHASTNVNLIFVIES